MLIKTFCQGYGKEECVSKHFVKDMKRRNIYQNILSGIWKGGMFIKTFRQGYGKEEYLSKHFVRDMERRTGLKDNISWGR